MAGGERAAASGYRSQYLLGAALVIEALRRGDLEAVRVADPEAGQVDDVQLLTPVRLDAYQVKWQQYPEAVTLRFLTTGAKGAAPLFRQLADGWQRLRAAHPRRRVVVHLATNAYPSTSPSALPSPEAHLIPPPQPYHFAAFLEQAWKPAKVLGGTTSGGPWGSVWEEIRAATGLDALTFADFVVDCELDTRMPVPSGDEDHRAAADLLFATAAGADRVVELTRADLLRRLKWERRYEFRNRHVFPVPQLYRPIQATVSALAERLDELAGGYLGVFGPPGSGKSTLLTRSLGELPVRIVRYYAFVPEAQDPTTLRGESANFLHDLTLDLWHAGFGRGSTRPGEADRLGLLTLLSIQLQELGDDYRKTGTRTVLLIDGLDHIAREQRPVRSLLADLPAPEAIPDGIFVVLGSQTDELADIPPRVRQVLREGGRRLSMGRLAPADVATLAREALADLGPAEVERVVELTDGHPLALLYLLNRLRLASGPVARASALAAAVPYAGDIEAIYATHWMAVEDSDALVRTLGLMARVRGAVPMRWVATWTSPPVLRHLQRLFTPYFEEDDAGRWSFFHNSFRLFLAARTAEPLPGNTADEVERAFHAELAALYAAAGAPWAWEALFHRAAAGDDAGAIELATSAWFREQVRALRPAEAVLTDVRVAAQAAGRLADAPTLLRLALVAAEVEQQAGTLELQAGSPDHHGLPALLLDVGEVALVCEHVRDGNRLRIPPQQALALVDALADAGALREAARVFELAEPHDLLSGRPIPDDHTRPQHLWDLLGAWARAATRLRTPDEVLRVVGRVRLEVSRPHRRENAATLSAQLRRWLAVQVALAYAGRGSWAHYEACVRWLRRRGRRAAFYADLRAAEAARDGGDLTRAHSILDAIGMPSSVVLPANPADAGGVQSDRAQVADLALALGDAELAARWADGFAPVPLSGDRGGGKPAPHEVRFLTARVRYALGEGREPEELVEADVPATPPGRHEEPEGQSALRIVALAATTLGQLWGLGWRGHALGPPGFVRAVSWVLDLVARRTQRVGPLFHALSGARADLVRYAALAAARNSAAAVEALALELARRWENNDAAWPLYLRREAAVALAEAGVDRAWARTHLEAIGARMLAGESASGRAEACVEQARAWLRLGESGRAREELVRATVVARGPLDDHDHQLEVWVEWADRANRADPDGAEERLRLWLRRLVAVDGTASGVTQAAADLLAATLRWRPAAAARLTEGIQEAGVLGHGSSWEAFLVAALAESKPPIAEGVVASVELLIPFGRGSDVAAHLVRRAGETAGEARAVEVARFLTDRIRACAPPRDRPNWLRKVAEGLDALGIPLRRAGIEPHETLDPDRSSDPHGSTGPALILLTGQPLSQEEAAVRARTVADFARLHSEVDHPKSRYGAWDAIVASLVHAVGSLEGVERLAHIVGQAGGVSRFDEAWRARALVVLSRHALALGGQAAAADLARRALDRSEPTGWDPWFDGGLRLEALEALVAADPVEGRRTAAQTFGADLGGATRYGHRLTHHFTRIARLLVGEEGLDGVRLDVESYVDGLFQAAEVSPAPLVESCLDAGAPSPMGASGANDREDTVLGGAIAAAVTAYLDHPSYVVAQHAVRACAALLVSKGALAVHALEAAVERSDEAAERALAALDGASQQRPDLLELAAPLLSTLVAAPHFGVRLAAASLIARVEGHGDGYKLERVPRPGLPAYETLVPPVSTHRTEDEAGGRRVPILVGDPARALRPLDMEARALAALADVDEDLVLYRAAALLDGFQQQRPWFSGGTPISANRLTRFLEDSGLKVGHHKPHIDPARAAVAYVASELWDADRLPARAVPEVALMLGLQEPALVLAAPVVRPPWIPPVVFPQTASSFGVPEGWGDGPADALPLLSARTPTNHFVVGEWTHLSLLGADELHLEDRFSFVEVAGPDDFWDEDALRQGHPPFARQSRLRIRDYLRLAPPLRHLVIAHDVYAVETLGARWLAFNPAAARALGWLPGRGGHFRWVRKDGSPAAESVWWTDGEPTWHDRIGRVTVGEGWAVLLSPAAYDEVHAWAPRLTRGGLVRRQVGWYGQGAVRTGHALLALP
jgi:hypothetical protein